MRWPRLRPDGLERRLAARMREPRQELVDEILNRIAEGERSSEHVPAPKLRLGLAVATTVTGLALAGAFGGLSYASSASQSLFNAVHPTKSTSGSGSTGTVEINALSPSANQYSGKTTICHRRPNGIWHLITVNNNSLPSHKAQEDTLPGAGGTCPGPPIP